MCPPILCRKKNMPRYFLAFLFLLLTASYAVGQETIYDIQFTEDPSGISPLEGQTVQTGGIVTGVNFNNQPIRYFIADRQGGLWRGILVNDNANRNLSVGDSVSFEARVQESSSQTRLYNITSGTFFSLPVSVTVPPTSMTSGDIGESSEGVLVELGECYVVDLDGGIRVDDGSGPVLIGTGWTFAYEPLIGDTLQYVRGIVSYSGEFAINPRNDSDFGFFSNRPPLISQVEHTPDRPSALDPVTVTALITDDTGLESVSIFYRFDESSEFSSLPMFDDGLHNDGGEGDNIWGARIPAGPERAHAQYYIDARDVDGAITHSPAAAPVETYEYFVRTVELSIFDIQYSEPPSYLSPYDGEMVTVTGIVTCENFRGGDMFISDPGGGPWSGVYVYNPTAAPARGDCVRVTAMVQEYNGLTELSSVSLVEILGPGTLPEPYHITYEELFSNGEPYEGVLVRADTCVVTEVGVNYFSYGQFGIRAGSQSGVLRVDSDIEYVPAPGDSFRSFTGVGDYNSNPGYMIAARDDADVGYIDRRAPAIVSAHTVTPYFTNILFNERVNPTEISDISNYSVINVTLPDFPTVPVVSAQLFSDQRTVQIEFLESTIDTQAYQLTISQVRDTTGNLLENAQISFSGYDPSPTVSIEDIYMHFDSLNNTVGTLRGVVNFVQDVTTTSGSRRISAFIQDESGYGYSLSQTGPASDFPTIRRGNLIEITGTINVYAGAIQLGSFLGTSDDVKLLSEGVNLPEPVFVRTGDRRLQSELIRTSRPDAWGSGTWCKTQGTVYQVDENVGGGTNIYIDDGSGNLTIRVWDSMYLDSVHINNEWVLLRNLVGKQMAISGPSSFYTGDFQMLAGYVEDFTDIEPDSLFEGPSDGLVLDTPNRPFAPDLGQSLTIHYNCPATGSVRLRVFNLRGQLVHTLVDKTAGGANDIIWDGRNDLREILPLGSYILHLESVKDGKSDSVIKPIVIGTKL
jgi:hypothetical protein